MKEFEIKLNGVDDIKVFNNTVTGIDGDVDLISGHYVVDAKSIMGIFSLDVSKPITCRIIAINEVAEAKAVSVIQRWVNK